MFKTLFHSFNLKTTYFVNSFIYAIKQIPIIKKVLPDSLYSIKGLKIIASIVFAFKELVSAFLGKFFYFAFVIFSMLNVYKLGERSDIFLNIVFFLSIGGALLNTYLFNPTRDKYYAMILLRMDAREYTLVNYSYAIIKLFIGFLLFGTIFGLMAGVPLYICLSMPFFVTGLKVSLAAFNLLRYEKTGCATNENLPSALSWIITGITTVAAYGLPFVGLALPQFAMFLLMLVPIITGVFSIKIIVSFSHFREVYKHLLQSTLFNQDVATKIARDQVNKLIVSDTSIVSNKNGYEYLNELFIKRHRKRLWKSAQKLSLIIVGVIVVASIFIFKMPSVKADVSDFVLTQLPTIIFIMYMINRGTGFTQALFVNCDHSLLTYSFFKKPQSILKLFAIRLREIVKINLLPASLIGLGLVIVLYLSDGNTDILNYFMLFASILAISVFFSVHYLMIYYLLQPYNANTELKSATYQIVSWATYFACFVIINVELSLFAFCISCIVFCTLYCIIACALVYFIAPKTFRLRI